uniref:WD_REPEATS_REGION domain-containing protein n=1 Tax=Globodera pallida TaxID=36090 RepID=A0A183CIS0_GLOPA
MRPSNKNPTNSTEQKHFQHLQRNIKKQKQIFADAGPTTVSSSNSTTSTASTSGPTSKRQRIRSECKTGNGSPGGTRQNQQNGGIPLPRQHGTHRQQNNYRRVTPNAATSSTVNGRVVSHHNNVRSAELSDLPGFSYDPVTKKYYRILENGAGRPPGSTLRHLRNLAVRCGHSNANPTNASSAYGHKQPTKLSANIANLPTRIQHLQLGSGGASVSRRMERFVEEGRLRGVDQLPSYSFELLHKFDVFRSAERNNILEGHCSRVLSFDVSVDQKASKRDAQRMEHAKDVGDSSMLLDSCGRQRCNTYGLCFEPIDNGICLGSSNRILVDMVLAPADRDVTCLLFATAHSVYQEQQRSVGSCPKIVTECTVNLRPIEFNLSEEGRESMSSPIYNAQWTSTEPIWSLCFNSNHMKICVGMEKCSKILNVLSGQCFYVGSRGRNVISCIFSKDGNTLFLGRKGADVSMLDLRMSSNHRVGELAQSPSTGYMHLLQTRPHTLVTENFEGKIKLWDVRGRHHPLAELEVGHRNTSHKLPCFVDAAERFVFAVGEDATVRGWSLHTGELLCSVTSPNTHQRQTLSYEQQLRMSANDPQAVTGADFPRVVFNSSWGGRTGNSALIIAADGDLLVHELLL